MILFNLIVCRGVFSVLARPVTMNWSAVAWCATATCLFLSPEGQWGSVDAPCPQPLPKNRLSVGIAFVLCSCMREAKGRHRILLLKSHWIQCRGRTRFLFPHQKHCTQPLTCEALLAFSRRVTPPFLQNNNKLKSNLTTETTPIGVTNVQGPSPASFPTVLFIMFPSLTYSPPPLPPSPLLSAWNRHSRKCILCKLSSRCYSWFHKWWWNGQESEGVNGKR